MPKTGASVLVCEATGTVSLMRDNPESTPSTLRPHHIRLGGATSHFRIGAVAHAAHLRATFHTIAYSQLDRSAPMRQGMETLRCHVY